MNELINEFYRYHLRWLVDEVPLRAEKIQHYGSSPVMSSRSMLHQMISITTEPELEIAPSSALILALEQLYNGITVFSQWDINTVINSQNENKSEVFYETLDCNFNQVRENIQRTFQGERIHNNIKKLTLSQVIKFINFFFFFFFFYLLFTFLIHIDCFSS